MKIAIIGSKRVGEKNNPEILAASLGRELDIKLHYWEDLFFDIKTGDVKVLAGNTDIIAEKYDLVICIGWYKNGDDRFYRDLAYSLALVLDKHGIKYWNSEMGKQRSTTKLSQMVLLALNDILIPNTRFSLDINTLVNIIERDDAYIVKAISGSRGRNNYRIGGKNAIKELLDSNRGWMLIQEIIPNKSDLRVICFNAQPTMIFERARQNDASHLNNTSAGAEAKRLSLTDVPEEVLTQSVKIAKLTNRELAGIDMILYDNKPFCLEVNAIPQLTTGTDTDIKMKTLAKAIKEYGEQK